MGKDADGHGEGCSAAGLGLMEAGQRNLGVAWAIDEGLSSHGVRSLQGLLPSYAVGPCVQGTEEEEGKHQHLSVRGRWNPQLTA